MQTVTRTRLDSLTSLRFFAALVVVLSHSTRDLVSVPVLGGFARNGTVGVGFFFALSGFVLAWSHRSDDTPGRFYRRRLARIYPMHILTYALSFPVLLLAGTNMASSSVNLGAALASPLLLQAWFPQSEVHYGLNAPSWSLSNEAFFYLLFPLLLPALVRLSDRVRRALLFGIPAVVLGGSVLWSTAAGSGGADWLYIDPLWRLLGFTAGVVLAQWVRGGGRVPVPFAVAASVAVAAFLLLAVFTRAVTALGHDSLAGLGVLDALMLPVFLLLIAAGATADLDGVARWIAKPMLIRLGEWSFALYLTHWLLIDLIVGIVPGVRDLAALPALLANAALVAAAIAVSAVAYQAIERPLERRLRGARPRPEELARPAA